MHHRAKDITGQKHEYLTIMGYHGSDGKKSLWDVHCSACGQIKPMRVSHFLANTSCGCQKNALIGEKNRTHGMANHPAYWVWRSMVDRCRLPTHQAWKNYGGRGITVSDDWLEFQKFWADMGPTYKKGLTLDRVDNEKGYCKENCRWATSRTQAQNRRNTVEVDGKPLSQWSRETGIGLSTLYYRYSKGLRGNDLFTTSKTVGQGTVSLFSDKRVHS